MTEAVSGLLESRLCEDGSHCAVHYAWAEARAALAGALGAMSVADAATRRVEPGS